LVAVALVVAIVVVLVTVSPVAAAGTLGALFLYLFSMASVTWRRVTDQYGFAVSQAPDGIRVRRGLFSTVSETIPFARVQAVRKIEPILWRLLGWCRLEVDVAGSPGQEQGTRSGRVTKSLLPVGRHETADALFSSLLGLVQFPLARPPARARWKSPLSYHFLWAGCDGSVAAASTGRLQKVTTWVPLEKVQSIRRVQGPLQRALHLATVHVDAAGRSVRAEFRDRGTGEADTLFERLAAESRSARRRASGRSAMVGVPPGSTTLLPGGLVGPANPAPPAHGLLTVEPPPASPQSAGPPPTVTPRDVADTAPLPLDRLPGAGQPPPPPLSLPAPEPGTQVRGESAWRQPEAP
jgi:putative membrane protein